MIVFDAFFNLAVVLCCAGLIGPAVGFEDRLAEIGALVQQARERQLLEKMTAIAKTTTGPALTLAALFEDADPDDLIIKAIKRFRCISWTVLRTNSWIIKGGGPLDVVGPAATALYLLSQPCGIQQCDVFLSHSWHDDSNLKWEALERWCDAFEENHNRPPTLWLDKVCIDQTCIKQDLECLPIFLAGCQQMLVLSGRTYTSRLWCCVELFVHCAMGSDEDDYTLPIIEIIGHSDEERCDYKDAWYHFDVSSCRCFDTRDKDRIFGVIQNHQGGVSAFDEHMRACAVRVLGPRRATVQPQMLGVACDSTIISV